MLYNFGSLVLWEFRFQRRSPRTWVAALAYVAFCLSVPINLWQRHKSGTAMETTRFLGHLLDVQPFLTLGLAMLVAGHRSGASPWPETRMALISARLSNTIYLLGRSTAHVILVSLVALVPLLGTLGLTVHAGWRGHDLEGWVGAWALRILPLVLVVCIGWLAMVTILGRELAAFGLTVLGSYLFLRGLNQVLFLVRWHLSPFSDWFGGKDFASGMELMSGRRPLHQFEPRYFPLPEAPFDFRLAMGEVLPQVAPPLGLALLLFGISTAYIRRGRRDVRPHQIPPDHSLRTYRLLLFRLREHLTPAPGLARTDRLMIASGVIAFFFFFAFVLTRQVYFIHMADDRYQAEGQTFAPLPASVVPVDWRLEGVVNAGGRLEVESRGSLQNQGAEPVAHLAFSLNEHLVLEQIEVPGRRVRVLKSWDRVRVDLEPAFLPGQTLEVNSRVSGTPGTVHFPFANRYGRFADILGRFRTATLPRELMDFSHSRFDRAISPQRVELRATDLGLVPRFTSWKLLFNSQVPEEKIYHQVDLDIRLDLPDTWFIADRCGNRRLPAAGGPATRGTSLMAGQCRTSLAEYGLFGGQLEVQSDDLMTFAALPSHVDAATGFRQSMAEVARLTAQAWPSLPDVSGLVAVDWPRPLRVDTTTFGPYEVQGQLILVAEDSLRSRFIRQPEQLVTQLLVSELLERRAVVRGQGLFFRRLFQTLMLQRMDLSRQKTAVVDSASHLLPLLQQPILTAEPYLPMLWLLRLPATFHDLTARIGTPALTQGVEAFLSAGPGRGDFDELMAALEKSSGGSLQRFADDFIRGTATPILELHDIESQRSGDGFRVRGLLRNVGHGEVFCPVVVTTEINQVQTLVRIDSKSDTPFVLHTTSKPLRLQLDPQGTCHRVLLSTLAALQETVDLESSS